MGGILNKLIEENSEKIISGIKLDFGPILFYAGLYPSLEKKYILRTIFHASLMLVMIFIQAIELLTTTYKASEHLPTAIQSAHLSFLVILSLIVFRAFTYYRSSLNEMYLIIVDDFEYEDLGELDYSHLTIENAKVRKLMIIGIPCYIGTMGALLVIVTPLLELILGTEKLQNFNGINFRLIFPSWTFYQCDSDLMIYLTSFLQFMTALFCSLIFISGVIGYLVVNQRILHQMKMLLFCVNNIEFRAKNRFHKEHSDSKTYQKLSDYYTNSDFQQCYFLALRKCVQHHHFIIRFLKHYKDIVSDPAASYLMVSSIMIAMSAYGLLAVDDSPAFQIQSFFFCWMEIFTIGLMCWYGEETSALSLAIGDVAYQTNWPYCSEKNKRFLRMLLTNTMTPLSPIESVINIKLNLETFSNVLNGSYTYVNLLYATRNK